MQLQQPRHGAQALRVPQPALPAGSSPPTCAVPHRPRFPPAMADQHGQLAFADYGPRAVIARTIRGRLDNPKSRQNRSKKSSIEGQETACFDRCGFRFPRRKVDPDQLVLKYAVSLRKSRRGPADKQPKGARERPGSSAWRHENALTPDAPGIPREARRRPCRRIKISAGQTK